MRQLPRAPPTKIAHAVSIRCRCFLEVMIKLGRKVGNVRSILREDLFFRKYHDFGTKIGKPEIKLKRKPFFLENTMCFGEKSKSQDQSSFFFREHQFLKILASMDPRFEYPLLPISERKPF